MGRQKKFRDVQPTPEVTTETVADSFVEDASKVEDQLPKDRVDEPEIIEADAVVDGVKMNLNIRSNPKVEPNNQIAILGKGTKLIVMSPDKPIKGDGETWYKVRLKNSKDDQTVGYAMKKYIRIL
ncbi:MAG: SH3 domain-containing protein [Bacilli bacterium]|nr:SH3 domain-containing protein [Bacilli bacterium]